MHLSRTLSVSQPVPCLGFLCSLATLKEARTCSFLIFIDYLTHDVQWPLCLRLRSAAARLLRLWVRIPPGAWMSVCCEVKVSVTSRTLIQRSFVLCINLVNEEPLTHWGTVEPKTNLTHVTPPYHVSIYVTPTVHALNKGHSEGYIMWPYMCCKSLIAGLFGKGFT